MPRRDPRCRLEAGATKAKGKTRCRPLKARRYKWNWNEWQDAGIEEGFLRYTTRRAENRAEEKPGRSGRNDDVVLVGITGSRKSSSGRNDNVVLVGVTRSRKSRALRSESRCFGAME